MMEKIRRMVEAEKYINLNKLSIALFERTDLTAEECSVLELKREFEDLGARVHAECDEIIVTTKDFKEAEELLYKVIVEEYLNYIEDTREIYEEACLNIMFSYMRV